jgi:hypothetical protein
MESKKQKSRNLSPYQFFEILQLEWIVADLRSRIYPVLTDKSYWNKVKDGKRKIIEGIAEKNHLFSTIFTDEEMKRIYEQKVYNEKGLPTFLYKDEEHKLFQEPFDLAYYYSTGVEVRFELYEEQKVGKVKSYTPFHKEIVVTFEEKSITLPVSEVTRIL